MYRSSALIRIFLSTPSARRATTTHSSRCSRTTISIHALCEEGDKGVCVVDALLEISIHALCEEGDSKATQKASDEAISIHALCEEGDLSEHQQ